MKISYYTIDDLRLGEDPRGVSGWKKSYFLKLEDAMARYQALSVRGIKSLGLTDGQHELELLRCLPLYPNDWEGEDVLSLEFRQTPDWVDTDLVTDTVITVTQGLDVRYCLDGTRIIPAPTARRRQSLKNAYLWVKEGSEPASAIRWIHVGKVGWLSPAEFVRRYSDPARTYRYPLVLGCRADGISRNGNFTMLEMDPWEYKKLECRTKERLSK